jgi:hypothetical protein
MISHTDGADLAWSATFTGEQDVYYLRIPATSSAIALRNAEVPRPIGNPLDAVASSTTIRFQMPAGGGRSKIDVFDAAGRHVMTLVDGYLNGGMHSVRWAGNR